MKVDLSKPLKGMRGTYKDSDLIYTERNGRVIGYARPRKRKKPTQDQGLWMTFQTVARRAWLKTSAAQMAAWNDFGKVLGRYSTDDRNGPRRGVDVFVRTNAYRAMMQLPVMLDAPTEPAPPPVASIEVLPAANSEDYSFVVHHGIRSHEDHAVFVRITAATAHPGIPPRQTALRAIKKPGADSFTPLPASGGTVTFTGSPIGVEPGKRFAVQMRIIRTTDGLVSEPTTLDTFR